MKETPLRLLEIKRVTEREIMMKWDDGHEVVYSSAHLRRNCECAACVSEHSGKRTLDPASVSDDIKIDRIELVGRYAIFFNFNDGHGTGIYPFETLRNICPCEMHRGGIYKE